MSWTKTALHLAADAGHPECVKLLVKYGANVQAADHDGITVLQAAVIGGDVDTCRLLCVLGANPDQPDADGDTPRTCAKDDPMLRDLLFRASMGQLEIDTDLQNELQGLGQNAAA
jgi:ankyrin repeat protein